MDINNIENLKNIKEKDKQYLFELQKFLDTASNIKDEGLRTRVITHMLKCDDILTKLYQKQINKIMENSDE